MDDVTRRRSSSIGRGLGACGELGRSRLLRRRPGVVSAGLVLGRLRHVLVLDHGRPRRRLPRPRLRRASSASSSASSSSGGSSSPSGATTSFSSAVTSAKTLDRDGVAADPLDRVHLELAAVDADLLLLPEPVGDVRRGDRAEERAGRACVDVEPQLERLEPRRRSRAPRRPSSPRGVPAARRASRARATSAGRRHLGEPARQQEVARVAARDVHDLAAQAELRRRPACRTTSMALAYLSPTYGSRAISRARLTATATWRWWRRQAPLIRRERILPFSET